jgi:CRISPR-associated exonuclease Cas4
MLNASQQANSNSIEESEETDVAEVSMTASDILEHLFCPRLTYFELYLKIPEHQEKRFKVQKGRTVHEDKMRLDPEYLRKKLGCVEREKAVYLSSKCGIRGIVDEVLFLDDGMLPLLITNTRSTRIGHLGTTSIS